VKNNLNEENEPINPFALAREHAKQKQEEEERRRQEEALRKAKIEMAGEGPVIAGEILTGEQEKARQRQDAAIRQKQAEEIKSTKLQNAGLKFSVVALALGVGYFAYPSILQNLSKNVVSVAKPSVEQAGTAHIDPNTLVALDQTKLEEQKRVTAEAEAKIAEQKRLESEAAEKQKLAEEEKRKHEEELQQKADIEKQKKLQLEKLTAEVKSAVETCEQGEVTAFANLDQNAMDRVYSGEALRRAVEQLEQLKADRCIAILNPISRTYQTISIDPDEMTAVVKYTPHYGDTKIYSVDTKQLVKTNPGNYPTQTLYMKKDLTKGWLVDSIVFDKTS
jgi:hypothetical protein